MGFFDNKKKRIYYLIVVSFPPGNSPLWERNSKGQVHHFVFESFVEGNSQKEFNPRMELSKILNGKEMIIAAVEESFNSAEAVRSKREITCQAHETLTQSLPHNFALVCSYTQTHWKHIKFIKLKQQPQLCNKTFTYPQRTVGSAVKHRSKQSIKAHTVPAGEHYINMSLM